MKNSGTFYVSRNTFDELLYADIIPYQLYFSDVNQTEQILDAIGSLNYMIASDAITAISIVNRTIEVFGVIVEVMEYIVLVVCVFFLTSFGLKNIRNSYYEIGVIKTLGGRNRDISGIFIVLTSIVGIFVATHVANNLIISSFEFMFSAKFYNLNVIVIYPQMVIIDLAIAIIIILFSALIPTLSLRKFKYIDILKAKE